MKTNRDNFSPKVKRTLERRVGARCSADDCRKPTCGPTFDPEKANNVGVAAHITAAAAGGARYDPLLSAAQRAGIGNGIWLCAGCATKIDGDPDLYTVILLNEWKKTAEAYAITEFDKAPVSREDYSALEAVALGRLKKHGLPDAMSRIGRLSAAKMEELDPRFSVDVAYNAGVTSYTYSAKQPVNMGIRIEPEFGDEFTARFADLAKHGKDLEIDARAVRFDGSPLFDHMKTGAGKMVLSTYARKSAVLKLSLERKGKRRSIDIDDVHGELVGGAESVTFSGKAFGGLIAITLTCYLGSDDSRKCSMNIAVDMTQWKGKSVRTLPYIDKAFEFYDSAVKGDKVVGHVEIEGVRAVTVGGSFGSKPESNPYYRLMRYTRNARSLLAFIGTDAKFDQEFSATSDEVRFVEETYQMMLVQPKVGGKGLAAASVTMAILPTATRKDLDNMRTVPHAVRIEYEYSTPLNLFGQNVKLPRIQLTYTMAILKKLGTQGPVEPGKTYRFKICPGKGSQFFAGIVRHIPAEN